jgi:hypothetical protein
MEFYLLGQEIEVYNFYSDDIERESKMGGHANVELYLT